MQDIQQSNALNVSPFVFYPLLESKARRVVLQGGQWSGKTVNVLAVLATKAASEPNKIITVTSESVPHLKGGAIRDFEKYIYPFFAVEITSYNKTDHIYFFKNGSIIEFKSFDSEQKALGAKRDYLFVNEANRFNYMTFFQLDSRTETQTIIDYNPSFKFWAHEKIIGEKNTDFFISDHRHNPFLSEEKHREIENIKDPELWKVYARGMTGNITGTIFPNWTKIPDEDFPKEDSFVGGLDYGYTNDPTCLMKILRVGNNIFLHECCYMTAIANNSIVQIARANGFKSHPIYSEHDPDSVAALRRLGLYVMPARKGPGSIKAGISKLNEFNVFYTASSKNIANEITKYLWVIDDEGKPTNEPIDKWNHAIDATRYGVYTHFFRQKNT
jgi:phage terminase large subunit